MSSNKKPKVLFILKRREDYSDCSSYSYSIGLSTGLINSANFVNEMLVDAGFTSNVIVVTDNNDIDKEVTLYKPDVVIIEALWVVPEKFAILTKLHPKVTWIVRTHSETPFVANEGIAMEWLLGYVQYQNVLIGINSPRFFDEMGIVLSASGFSDFEISEKLVYLPNYYPVHRTVRPHFSHLKTPYVNVGCFGAIRPLKNQLTQAIAALSFADTIGKELHFHVNTGRTEMKGEPIMQNLIKLFEGAAVNGHKLVIHDWMPHEEFMGVIRGMDMGMQVSFTETFNIVAADMVTVGIPLVISDEVPWAQTGLADPTNTLEISEALLNVWQMRNENITENSRGLREYVKLSKEIWIDYLEG